MLIAKSERKFDSFNLDSNPEKESYEALLNDPSITIIEKKFTTQTESSFEGESQTSISRLYVYVEYEVCSL